MPSSAVVLLALSVRNGNIYVFIYFLGIISILDILTRACSIYRALEGICIASKGKWTMTCNVLIRIHRLFKEKPSIKVIAKFADIELVSIVLAASEADISKRVESLI